MLRAAAPRRPSSKPGTETLLVLAGDAIDQRTVESRLAGCRFPLDSLGGRGTERGFASRPPSCCHGILALPALRLASLLKGKVDTLRFFFSKPTHHEDFKSLCPCPEHCTARHRRFGLRRWVGAVVGGVAGHYAGHHAVVGAIGGCVVGHHLAKQHAQEQARAGKAQTQTPAVANQ